MQSFTLSSSLGPFIDTYAPTSTSSSLAMSSAAATGQAQGYGQGQGPPGTEALSAMLLQGWGMTPQNLMFYTGLSLIIASIAITMVWAETVAYLEHFHRSDPKIVRVAVFWGTMLATSVFAVNIAQVYEISHHATKEFATIMPFLIFSELYIKLVSGLFVLTAGTYYSWRVWRLAGKRLILIPVFAVLNAGAFAVLIYVLVVGFPLPPIKFEALRQMGPYFKRSERSLKTWAWVVLGVDATTCFTLIGLIWRSKESLFSTETRLVRRLTSLIMESMVPPVIVLAIIASSKDCVGSWEKIFTTVLPLLYWQSLVFALSSRRTVRKLLDDKLAGCGIEKMSGDSGSTAVFVHRPRDARAWHDEEKVGGQFIKEEGRPQGLPRGA